MWHNNKSVVSVYAHVNPTLGFAIINGIAGWKRIKPTSSDGVTNVLDLLASAKANGRNVNVYIDADEHITAAYIR